MQPKFAPYEGAAPLARFSRPRIGCAGRSRSAPLCLPAAPRAAQSRFPPGERKVTRGAAPRSSPPGTSGPSRSARSAFQENGAQTILRRLRPNPPGGQNAIQGKKILQDRLRIPIGYAWPDDRAGRKSLDRIRLLCSRVRLRARAHSFGRDDPPRIVRLIEPKRGCMAALVL